MSAPLRTFGRTKTSLSPLGLGCSPLAGPSYHGTTPLGRGEADDDESIRALHCAFDRGVSLVDTADSYGAGHSERVLGKAIAGRREKVFVISKFGNCFDEAARTVDGTCYTPDYIRRACDASLKRLDTDYIDCYLFHCNHAPVECVQAVGETLEALVGEGKIRWFGWSTDHVDRADALARFPHCAAIEHEMNVLEDDASMLSSCEAQQLASVNRGPLAMGLLTGKYRANTTASTDDVRGPNAPAWMKYFSGGKPDEGWLTKVDAVREVLRSGGRTLAQGALGWLWARGEQTFPIPGFRKLSQVEENCGALDFGPLSKEQMNEIDALVGRSGRVL